MAKPSVKSIDRGWTRALAAMKRLAGSRHVAVGIRDGGRVHSSGLTLNTLMAIHELGAPAANIPERAPIRTAFDANVGKYTRQMMDGVSDVLDGRATPDQILEVLGAGMADDIRNGIRARLPPPDKPETIRRKGSAKPLVDTGHMLQSVDFLVETK